MKVYDCGIEKRDDKKDGSGDVGLGQILASRKKKSPKNLFIQSLRSTLDHRFALLCNSQPKGADESMILVGPTGIWLILLSDVKGVFRAAEESWEALDARTGAYKPARPNPIALARQKTDLLTETLTKLGIELPAIEPIVFFTDPGAHVDTARPAARIVLVDAVQRFITSVLTSPVALNQEAIQQIIEDYQGENSQGSPDSIQEIRDIYTLREKPAPKKPAEPSRLATISREEPEFIKRLSKFFPFTHQQWILIGLLLVVNLMILVFLVVVVVIIT